MRVAVVAGGLAIFVLILGSTTIVSTRNIGVVTTFGRPSGTLSNGLHAKAPWQSVTEMNGTIQIDNHIGDAATRCGWATTRWHSSTTACAGASNRPPPTSCSWTTETSKMSATTWLPVS